MPERFGSSSTTGSCRDRGFSPYRDGRPQPIGSSRIGGETNEENEKEEDDDTVVASPSRRTTGFLWDNGHLWSRPPEGKTDYFTTEMQVHDQTVEVEFVMLKSQVDAFIITDGNGYERTIIELDPSQ